MGYSYKSSDDAPLMCFNGAKSWQLGWYAAYHASAQPLRRSWKGTMIGLSESGMSLGGNSSGYAVVLKIKCHSQDDYYANFNRKTGCNKGAKEGADQVLITKRKRGTGYAVSTLAAKLSVGDSYTVNKFGGKRMTVLLNEIRWGLSNARASVQVTAN